MKTNRKKYLTVAYIFMIIECALFGFLALLFSIIAFVAGKNFGGIVGNISAMVGLMYLIIFLAPLAWSIPITIITKKTRDGEGSTLALGICTLLFANIISGIFIILADSADKTVPIQTSSEISQ